MSREHVIETLEWNVGFRSEEEAFDWQPRLARAVRGPAVDTIASVFDELNAAGHVLVLDSLTLDLGRLPADDFEAQLAERLRSALREALLHELGARRGGAVDAPPPLTSEASDAQTLRHYLARGYLPWSTGAGTANRLDDLARRAARDSNPALDQWLGTAPPQASQRLLRLLAGELAQSRAALEAALLSDGMLDARIHPAWKQLVRWDADWLVECLRLRGQAAHVRRRMARAFTQAMLLDLVGLLVPTEREFVAQVMDEEAVFERARESSAPASDLRPRLWEFTLTYLLVERGSDFNRRSYMGSLLQQAARHEGMDYEHLLHAMGRALRKVSAPTGLQRQLLQLLDELVQDEGRLAVTRAGEEAASIQLIAQYDRYGQAGDEAERRKIEGFRLLLQSALLVDTPPSGALHQAWTELVRWDAPWLVEQARLHGQDAQVRLRMARGFAQEMLLELTELLVPGERGFVQEVVGQSALFARAHSEAHDQATPPGELRPRLWEFTLTYLLVERGSEFNRRSYMGSLLRQMASHSGLRYGELLRSMTSALRAVAAPTGLQRQMLQLLDGLVQAHEEVVPVRGPAPGTALWTQRELPALRFRWQAALATGDLRGTAVDLAWSHLVRHDTSWLLQETLARAQSEPVRRRMARDLPEEALLALVELLVPSERGFVEAALAQSAQLHRTVVASAGALQDVRVQLWEFTLTFLVVERGSEFNRRSYIGSLLRQMAGREGLGLGELLGALAASLRALGTAGELQRQMLRLTMELLGQYGAADVARSTRAPQAAPFVQALEGTGNLSPARVMQLVQDAEALFAHGGSGVRAALEEALRSPESVARLAALLPARLLTRLVRLLRREHHHALQRAADLIADAVVAAGTQVPRARLQSLKWQFILRYLFVEGRQFTVADFARRFTDWLAGQLRVAQPAQWRASLSAHAARDKRSAGQALGQAVAAALVSPSLTGAAPSAPKPARRTVPAKPSPSVEEPAQGEPIYVANAGLVICEPYLPRLFTMLGLTEGSAFRDAACAGKAVRLVQFVATGSQQSPEHQLVLNKLLCGLQIGESVDCETPLEDSDKATVDGMLKGMLAHWKSLGGTTPDGLRETFLQRQGRLVRQEEHWHLLVEPGPYDMLLDQLPWGFSMIKYPWMERMIHVQWR